MELEHQELTSSLYTISWIMFTVMVTGFLISLTFAMNGEVSLSLVMLILLIVAPGIVCYKVWGKIADRTKEIRELILEL
ncbi:MAG: hypothetical protein PHS47_00560 [Methanocellales archaeon]|nr:hypothetical protein [Methanocellales archaeon]